MMLLVTGHYTKDTTSTMDVLCHMFNNAPITYVNKNLKIELKDSKGKPISQNNYKIDLKRIPEGLLEYNAVFKWESNPSWES